MDCSGYSKTVTGMLNVADGKTLFRVWGEGVKLK